MSPHPRVILITDPATPLTRLLHVVHEAGAAIGDRLMVHLRDPAAPVASLRRVAEALLEAARRNRARFVINARQPPIVDLSIALGADGVHVPRDQVAAARVRGGADLWISCPSHHDDDVGDAIAAGASALLVSPIGETPGKGPPRGVAAIAQARAIAEAAGVFALGGIDPTLAAASAKAGADGVAVIRALLSAADPATVARALAFPFSGTDAGP